MELATQQDEIVRGVFAIALRATDADGTANPPVVHLAGLAEVCTEHRSRHFMHVKYPAASDQCHKCVGIEVTILILRHSITNSSAARSNIVDAHRLEPAQELRAEAPDAPVLFTSDNLERALMARLMEPPEDYPQWPVYYLCALSSAPHVHAPLAAKILHAFYPSSVMRYGARSTVEVVKHASLESENREFKLQMQAWCIWPCVRAHPLAAADRRPTAAAGAPDVLQGAGGVLQWAPAHHARHVSTGPLSLSTAYCRNPAQEAGSCGYMMSKL